MNKDSAPNETGSTQNNKESISKQQLDELDEISERVVLVENSLLSAYYQNRWDSVGLQQIINRLSMLLLERCVIVILKQQSKTVYEIIHHTCLDPFWKNDFEHYLESNLYKDCLVQDEKEKIIIDTNKLPGRKIEAVSFGESEIEYFKVDFGENILGFYKDIYFMFHRIIPRKESRKEEREFPPISIRKNLFLKNLSKKLRKLFDNPKIEKYLTNYALVKNIARKAAEWKGRRISEEQPQALQQDWPEDGKAYFEGERFERIKKIFDREYQKIQQSPLLVGGDNAPNIFFTVRTFSQTEKRFHDDKYNKEGSYPYSVRLVIPDAQKQDLEKAFLAYGKEHSQPESRPCFWDAQGNRIGDDFFWEKVKTEEGVSDILEELKTPSGLCVRGMSDTVFVSGYISIKEDPFIFGGRNRLEQMHLDQKWASRDYRYFVYFHYMLLMLSPKKDILPDHRKDKLYALIAPGSVGGSPFFCTGFVFTRENLSDHQSWLSCYHFYHSIRHYLIRSVRRQIRDLYLKEIQEIYETSQDEILIGIASNRNYEPQDVCDVLNPRLKALSRVYPFEYLEFAVVPDNDEDKYEGKPYFFHSYIEDEIFAVNIHSPPFFVRHFENDTFLEREMMEKCLSDSSNKLEQKLRTMIYEYEQLYNKKQNNK